MVRRQHRIPEHDFVACHDQSEPELQVPQTLVRMGNYRVYCTWYLIDPLGVTHKVMYEIIRGKGYLTSGWSQLRHDFGFTGMCWFLFKCVGRSRFKIVVFNAEHNQIKYHGWPIKTEESDVNQLLQFLDIPPPAKTPPFKCIPNSTFVLHNYETDNPSFTVTLKDHHAKGSQLDIPVRIGNHLKKFGSQPLLLKGPYDDPDDDLVECKIIFGKGKTKLGSGWKEFCQKYGLAAGDVCAFKFDNMKHRIVDINIAFDDE